MKKLLMLMVTLMTLSLSSVCDASAYFFSAMQGQWYDSNNKLVFVIEKDNINGHILQSMENLVGSNSRGGAIVTVVVNGKPLKFNMTWDALSGNTKILTIGNEQYHAKVQAKYVESVGGVYLGMLRSEVEKYYGVAPVVKDTGHSIIYYYPSDKWAIAFEGGVVRRIAIPKGSTRKFDKSGLNAYNSFYDYKTKYADSSKFMERIILGNGEYIWKGDSNGSEWVWKNVFSGDYVELNVFGD